MTDPASAASPQENSGALAGIARHAPLLLAAITVAGAILRVFDLGDKSLWHDEAVLFWIADGNLGEILAENTVINSAPPLFALLLAGITRLGTSEAALRSLACIGGIAMIPAVYALARRYVEAPWALFASVLVALSPQHIALSQQVREYSLAVCLAVLLLLSTQAFLDRGGIRQALVLGAITVFALVTQYSLGLLVAALALVSLVSLARSRASPAVWARWAGVQVAGLAAVAVDIALGLPSQLASGKGGVLIKAGYLEPGYWDGSASDLQHLVLTQTGRLSDFAFPGLLFGFFVLTGLVVAIRTSRGRMASAMLVVPIIATFIAALAHLHPYNGERQVIFLTPMFYVMAAFGASALSSVPRGWVHATIGGLLLSGQALLAIRAYYWSDGPEPLRPLLAELRTRLGSGDRIYVFGRTDPAFSYYVRGTPLAYHAGIRFHSDTLATIAEFKPLLQNSSRMWLVSTEAGSDGRASILAQVPPHRNVQQVREAGGAALFLVE